MTEIIVITGLFGSVGAFLVAVRNFHRMVEMHRIHPTIAEPKFNAIRNTLLSLVVATGLLYATFTGAGLFVYSKNATTTDAICALRGDLQTRVDSSREFIKDHPNGIPGISIKVIQDGIKNQERTIDALSPVPC